MSHLDSDPHLEQVRRYYRRPSSRLGYRLLLGETKHYGWYEPGHSKWRFAEAMRRMEKVLGERLALSPGSTVLDAGCGAGDVARTLARRHGLHVTGIDILNFKLEIARRRSRRAGLSNMTDFLYGDYHKLQFADASFDGVYTMETFVHAADPDLILAEFLRVLRRGGRLVMFEYSRTPATQLTSRENDAFRQICALGAMPAWLELNHGELERRIERAGFALTSTKDVTAKVLPMLHAFSIIARIPYLVSRLIGRADRMVNAIGAVGGWTHQHAWRYNIYEARRP